MNNLTYSPFDPTHSEIAGAHRGRLPEAINVLIENGLERKLALILSAELNHLASVVEHHKEYNRISNGVFLDDRRAYESDDQIYQLNDTHEIAEQLRETITRLPRFDTEAFSFSGDVSEVVAYIMGFAETANKRFQEPSQSVGEKKSLALDLGYVNQRGDWDKPEELDRIVSTATDKEVLVAAGYDVKVVKHDRNHPKIRYEFWNTSRILGDRAAIVVLRKRPGFDIDDIEIFRKSWFLVSASAKDHPRLYQHLLNARSGRRVDNEDNDAIARFVHDTLIPESERPADTLARGDRKMQSLVLPGVMTYVAQIRNPNYTCSDEGE